MWPQQRSKEAGLPITQDEHGFVQRSSWRQVTRPRCSSNPKHSSSFRRAALVRRKEQTCAGVAPSYCTAMCMDMHA